MCIPCPCREVTFPGAKGPTTGPVWEGGARPGPTWAPGWDAVLPKDGRTEGKGMEPGHGGGGGGCRPLRQGQGTIQTGL